MFPNYVSIHALHVNHEKLPLSFDHVDGVESLFSTSSLPWPSHLLTTGHNGEPPDTGELGLSMLEDT